MRIVTLLSADTALGRFDVSSLPDQTLMELFIEGMEATGKLPFRLQNGFKDVCTWSTRKPFIQETIRCTDGRVTRVLFWFHRWSEDQFPFHYTPPLVTYFSMKKCQIHGTLDASALPVDLQCFQVPENKLSGEVKCGEFPRKIERISLVSNVFTGSLHLADLPDSVIEFHAEYNELSGSIHLNDLPPQMAYLTLQNNKLTGEVHIDRLPPSIHDIDLSENCFKGELRLLDFPKYMKTFGFTNNFSVETAVFRGAKGPMHFEIRANCITSVVDEAGNKHDWTEMIIRNNS